MQLQPLLHDVDESLCLARAAFGNDPEAVNIWIGDERSVSSVHKDHYGSALYRVPLSLTRTGVWSIVISGGHIRSLNWS
jgi:hypothetical protein